MSQFHDYQLSSIFGTAQNLVAEENVALKELVAIGIGIGIVSCYTYATYFHHK
jgi:hypothetical protein